MIVEDRYVLPPAEGDYLSVRALTVRGTDEEIGAELARLARRDYDARLARYADPMYGTARQAYLERSWPALAARSRGVAGVFGLPPGGGGFDTTCLGFDMPAAPACSAVWVPPSLTSHGRPLIGRNLDWYTLRLSEFTGLPRGEHEHPSYSRTVALTFQPEQGHMAMQIGSHDLLNPMLDGVNDAGLFTAILVDHTGRGDTGAAPAGGYDHGISTNQVLSFLMSEAATVTEAKMALLAQHIYTPVVEGEHWLIADAQGAATVFEIDGNTRQYRFVDGQPDAPLIVTNHALHTYPTITAFPDVDAGREHNTFVRFRKLSDAIAGHEGVWAPQDVGALLDVVACGYVDAAVAGVSHGLPERTLWTYVADPVERTFDLGFFQHDLGQRPGTNRMNVQRTPPITLGGFSRPAAPAPPPRSRPHRE